MQEVRENCENYNRRYATNTGVVFAPFEHPCDVAAEHRTIATLSHRENLPLLMTAPPRRGGWGTAVCPR